MTRCSIIFLIALCSASTFAQKIDSVKYGNGFLFYHEYGKGEPIILLAGGPGNNCLQLADMARKLSNHNRVILLEERGTGLSIPNPLDSTTINLAASVSDINLLLNHLGLEEAIICGHSWGATLGLLYTSSFPEKVKSLILIAPSSLLMGDELRRTIQYNRDARNER